MVLRVAVVGSGEMGRKYAEALARYVSGTSFAGVAGGSRAAALASAYGVPHLTVESAIAQREIDAVVIATPHSTHVPLATAAASHRKHVYIEKPLARDIFECDQIIEACQQSGVKLAVNTVTRFRPSPIAAKRALDAGLIGSLRMVRVLSSAVGYEPEYKSWTSDPQEGGIWLDWGCHGCDALRWFVGASPIEAFGRMTDYSGGPALDRSVMAQFAFPGHVTAQLLMSFEMPAPGLGSASQWTFIGSDGVIELDGYAKTRLGTVSGWRELSDQLPFDFDREPLAPHLIGPFGAQLQDFVDAIRDDRDPLVTGADGRASVEMVEAARRSSVLGRSVALPLEPVSPR